MKPQTLKSRKNQKRLKEIKIHI